MQPRFAEEETTDPAMFAFGTVCELSRTYGGRYRVEELLGKGGIGEVYAAIDLETDRPVAFKVLLHRHQEDRAMVHRFRNEGRIGLRLRHENIVPVYAMGHDEACGPFIVMERLVGATLAQLCESLGQWPLEQALLTAICIADVVAGLHKTRIPLPDGTVTGIIHRDLKPDNIFMVRQGDKPPRPVLLDFGLAKLVGDLMAGSANTSEGTRVGTARYMSPEQARGDVLTPASDIYSLGIIVYEMLTNRHVYGRDDSGQTPDFIFALWHQTGDLVPLDEVLPDCPAIVWSVLKEALARDTKERFRTMEAFSKALMAAYQEAVKASARPDAAGIVARIDRELQKPPGGPDRGVPSAYGLRVRDAVSKDPAPDEFSEIIELVAFGEEDVPLPAPSPLDERVPLGHPARNYAKNLETLRMQLEVMTLEAIFKLRRMYRLERAKMEKSIDEATSEHNQRKAQNVRVVLSETDLFLETATALARRRVAALGFRAADQRASSDAELEVAELTDKLAMIVRDDKQFAANSVAECEKNLALARTKQKLAKPGEQDEAAFLVREYALRMHILRGALRAPQTAPEPAPPPPVDPRVAIEKRILRSTIAPSPAAAPVETEAFVPPAPDQILARLEVIDGPTDVRFFDLVPGIYGIGRAPDAEIFVDEPTLSAVHAELRPIAGSDTFAILDKGGRNGTFVQGERVTTPRLLRHGDRIALGLLLLQYHHARAIAAQTPAGLRRGGTLAPVRPPRVPAQGDRASGRNAPRPTMPLTPNAPGAASLLAPTMESPHMPAAHPRTLVPATMPSTDPALQRAVAQHDAAPVAVQRVPVQQIPVQQIPVQQAPMQQASMQQAPTQQAAVRQGPAQHTGPMPQSAMQQAPHHPPHPGHPMPLSLVPQGVAPYGVPTRAQSSRVIVVVSVVVAFVSLLAALSYVLLVRRP